SAEWAGGNLTLGTTNAEVGVEGLDLATASDPSSGVVLSLERAEWDTSTNELGLADLGVRGAGGRMRIDGLVALPPAGSGLERVSGDLAGQLSVEQPDEFAALLGRLGIAPEMPEGYSIGTSLTADFALSGARANRADTQSSTQTDPRLDGRLSLGLRARGPFVPGLAFESIEVDATITSVSLATNSLRGQAIEVLAIATEPYSGADFTVSAEAAEWDAAAKEIRVGGLVAHAGGGRLRMDGLVSLPPDGSGLERVGGDLAGQLAIEEPDELAAVLARIGLAPPLPEGFSIGTSLALDFALGDARGELDDARPDAQPDQRIGGRLSAGLRARGPAAPGLTFESFEAEGAISSNSVTLDQLRVRTAGALGTLDGSGSFTADSLELELDADAIPLAFLVGLLDPDLSAGAAGTVSVRMHVEGSPESPTIALIAQGELLAIEGEPVTVAVNVRQEAGEIRLDTLTVDLADFAEVRGTGSAPLTFGTSGLAAGNLATAEMRIDASLPGAIPYLLPGAAERWPEAALELTSTLDGRAASVRASATGFERAEELTIVGIEPMTDFQLAASIADVLDLPSTLTAELTSGDTLLASVDTDLEGGLSGEARLPVAELSHFASGIDLPGGLLRASFRIPNDGTGARGEVTLENVMMKLSPLVPTVSSLNGSLIYADEIIRTDDLSGEMGGSPVSLSGSYSLLEREGGRMQVRLT
ncbi:MAG TPA: hypothetical protein VKA74_08150, partial [Myxococcota bacterium]|nr:hypothetical protein [Myxococcota bacterium]